jgi:outer membrane protein W
MWVSGMRWSLVFALTACVFAPARAEAQSTRGGLSEPRHSVMFNVGYVFVSGEGARGADDTLVINREFLAFDIKDFNGATFGAAWLYGLGNRLEAGVGIDLNRRNVSSVYHNVRHSSGAEVAQDLKLRMVPMTATVRYLPMGRGGSIEPYIGAGVALINWEYSETGEFVDFGVAPAEIFRSRYVASGNAVGPVVVGGLRAPVTSFWILGAEIRYQRAKGDTDAASTGLLGNRLGLGGWSTTIAFGVRF